jgi:hypothetical protein
VQQQAYVLAFIDGFALVGGVVIGALLLIAVLRTPADAEAATWAARRGTS